MKVIEPGRKQKGWAKECRCTGAGNGGGGCRAKVLVEQRDLFQTGRHSYDGSSEYFVTFKCGACSVLNDIENTPFHAQSLPTQRQWESKRADDGPEDTRG